MAQLRSTTAGGMAKYIGGGLNMFTDSMRSGKQLKWNTQTVIVKNNAKNKSTLEEWAKLAANRATEKDANALELECNPNAMCSIGSFEKPTAGAAGNRGDIAEGILGAAITARFINKNQSIDKSNVKAVLNGIRTAGTGKVRNKDFESPNADPSVVDNVNFYLGLATVNMNALLDKDQWMGLDDLFNSAVKYANGATVKAWSKLLYENNQLNKVEVISDGISNQQGTKVDIKVVVDGKPTDINISLKAGDVKQFGQIGGIEFEKQITLHKMLFGIDVSHLKDTYQKCLSAKDPKGALYAVYNYVAQEINNRMTQPTKKRALLKEMGTGIKQFATLNEANVTLVQLSSSEAKVFNFDGVVDAVAGLKIKCTIKDSAGKPKLLLHNDANKNLLEIRVKQENKPDGSFYIRNYVEKGALLGDLIAIYA